MFNSLLLSFGFRTGTISKMQNYQLTVLVKNNLDEKAKRTLFDDVVKQFAKLTKEDLWGARGLAYPIAHQDKAFYAHFEFEAEPNKISALDKSLKLNEDIIRFLLLRKENRKIKKVKVRKIEPNQTSELAVEDKEAEIKE